MVGFSDGGVLIQTLPLLQPAGLEVGLVGNALLTDPALVPFVASPEELDSPLFGSLKTVGEKLDDVAFELWPDYITGLDPSLRDYQRLAREPTFQQLSTTVAERLGIAVRFDPTDAAFQRFKAAFYETHAANQMVRAAPAALAPKLSFEERYEILGKIGKGGQVIAYKVRDRLTGELGVARRTTDPEQMDKLIVEAKALMSLDHPNIVKVHDYYIVQDARFGTQEFILITNYVEGKTLSEFLAAKGRLTEVQLTHFKDQMLAALREAHAHGIVHRDIKPSNVVMSVNGDGSLKFTLIDFGLIKFVGGSTGTKSLGKGTINYMAPEQISGEAITPETDIHGLGLTLLAMSRGKERKDDIRHQVPAEDIAKLRNAAPAYLSEEFLDVIETMLDEDPRKRMQWREEKSKSVAIAPKSAVVPLDFDSGLVQKVFGESVWWSLAQGGGAMMGIGGLVGTIISPSFHSVTSILSGVVGYVWAKKRKEEKSIDRAQEIIIGSVLAANGLGPLINGSQLGLIPLVMGIWFLVPTFDD